MILLFVLSITCAKSQPIAEQSLMLGILEHHDARWNHWPDVGSTGKYKHLARPLFRKIGGEWRSLDIELKESTDWFVGFDGRNIGKISSQWKQWDSYGSMGLHEVAKSSFIPTIGNLTTEFSNWVDGDVPRYRPLILSTNKRFDDPQRWKPYQPNKSELSLSVVAFRNIAGKFVFGDEKHGDTPTDEYGDTSVRIVKAYKSTLGDRLVNLALDHSLFFVDGPIEEELDYWIHLDASGKAKALAIHGPLVDAGDFDGDGESEIVFAYSGYNKDGYVLLFSNLTKTLEKFWSYH